MSDLSMFDLSGRNAIVTGGAMGIGLGFARALAKAGANVAIVDVNEALGSRNAEALEAFGVKSLFVFCDVSSKKQVQTMVNQVQSHFGRLDIGVNNAGFGILGNSEELEESRWRAVLDVNLTGAFLCAQAQAQHMIRQSPCEGKIINTASMYGLFAGGNCAYNASKAGLIHLTRSLASEWGQFNINVNCISPGWVMTPGMSATPPEVRARMREVTPMGHLQRPEDLCGAIVFLASRASNFVTGHNLVVDGGHSINTWLQPLHRSVPPRVSQVEEDDAAREEIRILNALRASASGT